MAPAASVQMLDRFGCLAPQSPFLHLCVYHPTDRWPQRPMQGSPRELFAAVHPPSSCVWVRPRSPSGRINHRKMLCIHSPAKPAKKIAELYRGAVVGRSDVLRADVDSYGGRAASQAPDCGNAAPPHCRARVHDAQPCHRAELTKARRACRPSRWSKLHPD